MESSQRIDLIQGLVLSLENLSNGYRLCNRTAHCHHTQSVTSWSVQTLLGVVDVGFHLTGGFHSDLVHPVDVGMAVIVIHSRAHRA